MHFQTLCFVSTTVVPHFNICKNYLESWLIQVPGNCPTDYDLVGWDGACECVFLTRWQLMPALLTLGPHLEKHHSKDRCTSAKELWQLQFTLLQCSFPHMPTSLLPVFFYHHFHDAAYTLPKNGNYLPHTSTCFPHSLFSCCFLST